MKRTIEELLKNYGCTNADEAKMALREITQSVILIGLSRGGFFKHASFYGGTALRIFYGLNRYSEDLDFTLNAKNDEFSLDDYIPEIRNVGLSYGLDFQVETKKKKKETPVESAFAKLNTYETFISLKVDQDILNVLHKDEVMKVKFEIDRDPSLGFEKESKWIDLPEFAPVVTLDESSLFAGKIHAILCRNYKNTVKGRDYYDFLFYIQRRTKPNLTYLRNKLIDSDVIKEDESFSMDLLKKLLKERFLLTDFAKAREDASRFIFEDEDLSFYSSDFFIAMLEKIPS